MTLIKTNSEQCSVIDKLFECPQFDYDKQSKILSALSYA